MKKALLLTGLLLGGCANQALICSANRNEIPLGEVEGRYILTNVSADYRETWPRACNEVLADWLVAESPRAEVFRPDPQKQSVPVSLSVTVNRDTKENMGIGHRVGASVNNLVSYCTLLIWPKYGRSVEEYTVTVKGASTIATKTFTVEERSLTSWLPTGLIPVPAMADSRERRAFNGIKDDLVKTTSLSLFTDKIYQDGLKASQP